MSSVAAVVGVVGEDGEGAVELLGEDYPGEFVGECHGAQGEQQSFSGIGCGCGAGLRRPAVGGTDGEDEILGSLVAEAADPLGEVFGGERLAPGVEQDDRGRGAGAHGGYGLGKGGFGAEGFGFDWGVLLEAFEIESGEGLEGAGGCACGDGRYRHFHVMSLLGRRD